MVILEKPAQALAACDDPDLSTHFRAWLQDPVIKPLMCAFTVIMKYELGRGVAQRRLSEEDDS